MSRWYLSIAVILCGIIIHPTHAQTQELLITGVYQGKNLYVQNPLCADRSRFCTEFVYVNDRVISSNPRTSAYTIDLSFLDYDDPVIVRITHMAECEPKIINPQVIRLKGDFQFLVAQADRNDIRWSTRGEKPASKFFLESFRMGEWKPQLSVDAKGDVEANTYSIAAEHLSGTNRYRIRYLAPDGAVTLSKEFVFRSEQQPVTFYPVRVLDQITLSREAEYEIHDAKGTRVLAGKGKFIDVLALETGLYYLIVDNRKERFMKK
ncbi:MAG TPA: hypothetical protein DCE41_00360 [Cytophagales bacterium]|nr:hypothetical protein [Cytophagales bacterium]HAA22920.1 hypothetical protein [Cytophagales bacterium]HAP62576.1 hypothetical protein [Cytophagales bacterium]